jgi:hypothetical protein
MPGYWIVVDFSDPTVYLVDDFFVESFEPFGRNSFEGPDLVPTLGNLNVEIFLYFIYKFKKLDELAGQVKPGL